ncbi:hypothetical protein DPMN_116141 [Dreissena polymorpha]|uniref:Uncharacterized protein n=1 Tax=Dreissena polymorpha TaxID=45954 RepID=A0A9D4QT94_DREPO|nr:hypothetical protein DPMN_116141 [Dreissena polymorpha]
MQNNMYSARPRNNVPADYPLKQCMFLSAESSFDRSQFNINVQFVLLVYSDQCQWDVIVAKSCAWPGMLWGPLTVVPNSLGTMIILDRFN